MKTASIPHLKLKLTHLAMLCLTLGISRASAVQLTWDPLGNNGGAGSGNWDTTGGNTVWWNGASDVVWSQTSTTSPTQGAIFNGPDAAPGTYSIVNDAVQVAVTNLLINNSGYTFSGANAIYLGANDFLSVAAGKTVTFNCNMAGSGTSPCWTLGSGATMNVGGNLTSGQQLRLAGPVGSAFNLTGTANAPAIMFILAPVNLINTSLVPSSSFYIGYTQTLPAPNSTAYSTGALTLSGSSTIFTVNGNILIIGRSGGSGTLTINDGTATIGNTTARNLGICYDGNGSTGIVNVNGGSLNVGNASHTTSLVNFVETAAGPGGTGVMTQTAGTVNAWGGILFGAASGSYSGASAALTNSGGNLYVGLGGITRGAAYTSANNNTISISLSGGTVGALANWSSSLPMTLDTPNGNITFQCADGSGNPFNISLSGALTGTGGLNVTGGGVLILSGANNYAGSTVVSNGTLAIVTSSSPMISGPVTLDGSTGSPIATVTVSNPGQYWTNNGTLTFQNGSSTADFEFGALPPSTTVAPLQVNGNVAFAATPSVTVGGSAIATGTYPLIKYTGVTNGVMPTSVNLSGGYALGYITNISATKTIALVVTSSTYNPALYWGVGNGLWDINGTANWKQFGNSTKYTDGSAVVFDDSASGTSPITVSLNTTVNPLDVTANNSAKNYIISGTGSITGSGNLSLVGSGAVTLAGTNTFSGGTIIGAGQLNINNGGSATATAIGTGPLTINAGAKIDNTSGSNVTLQASIAETWNGNFTYLGSANNFNTGAGAVTMNTSITISNNANNFTVGGSISDNGNVYQLSKTGNGILTLPVPNSFFGGLSVYSGVLNFGDPGAAGYGAISIYGGAIDNSSGAPLTLSAPPSYLWAGSFSFLGSSSLNLNSATVVIPNGLGNITVNVAANTLTTVGDIANNNTEVIKTGNGTWEITGPSTAAQSLGLVVSAGQVNLHKTVGQAIQSGNNVGLTVLANARVLDETNFQIHSDTAIPMPVSLSGGLWDLNGWNENVDKLSISSGGTLRNGAPASTSTLNTISGYTAMLSGANCQFDVTAVDGILNFKGAIGGSGSLVKVGLGVLNLLSNNVYTGSTVISNGTIALLGVASISNTPVINLASVNSILDLSSNNTPLLTLQSGQTLSGFGTVNGPVQALSGSIVAPGSASPATVGTLTVANAAGTTALNGTTMMKLDKGNLTNDQLSVSGNLMYGGTLALTNLTGSLAVNDSFPLFQAGTYSGSFTSITPSSPGPGLAWDTSQLAVSGKLKVIAPFEIGGITVSGTSLSITGSGGTPSGTYHVRTSTNAAAPLSTWTVFGNGSFDSHGNFNFSGSINPAEPKRFYILVTP